MPIAITEIVIISALDCRKMFAIAATSSMIMPTNRNLPIAVRSRLMTRRQRRHAEEDQPPVPANAIMIRPAPLAKPSTAADQARQHQAHEEREGEQQRHAGRRVLVLLDREHEAERADEEDDRAHADAHRAHRGRSRRRSRRRAPSAPSRARAASRCCAGRGCADRRKLPYRRMRGWRFAGFDPWDLQLKVRGLRPAAAILVPHRVRPIRRLAAPPFVR